MRYSMKLGGALAASALMLALAGCGTTTAAKPAGPGKASAAKASTAFYHEKTLTIIVPYGAGGGYDLSARFLAPHLKQEGWRV